MTWTEMAYPGAGSRGRRTLTETRDAGADLSSLPDVGNRKPPHPGHFLETRFLKPIGLNQAEFAQRLGVSRRRVNELLRGRRGITLDTAVRLARFFGNDAEFWMRLQLTWDLHAARQKLRNRSART